MMEKTDAPRYMALNSGQEAFQLFYERLLDLDRRHKLDKAFYSDNKTHLKTIINTFNRHYCTGVGSTNPFHDVGGAITPIFLNLGIYNDPKYNLHRLLGIHLNCSNPKHEFHAVYLLFDHPAYDKNNEASMRQQQKLPGQLFNDVFITVSLKTFETYYYRDTVYFYRPEGYEALDLIYNEATRNFTYKRYTYSESKDESQWIIWDSLTPPFSNLQITGRQGDVMLCTDERIMYTLLRPYAFDEKYYWTLDPSYMAHNRYYIHATQKYTIQSCDGPVVRRLLPFLFGCNDMIYVFENFRRLVYTPVVSIKMKDSRNIPIVLRNRWEGRNGYPVKDDPSAPDSPFIEYSGDSKATIREYIDAYHRLHNYFNCIDTTYRTVLSLLDNQATQSPRTVDDLVEAGPLIPSGAYGGAVTIDVDIEGILSTFTTRIASLEETLYRITEAINKSRLLS